MVTTVDFLPFANGTDSPNVVTQAAYVAAQSPGLYGDFGFVAGIAQSNQLNKVWRQSSVMSAALANFLANTLNQNVLDSGGPTAVTTLTSQIASAVSAQANGTIPPIEPQGRLTLTTGAPIISGDVLSSTVVYYTQFNGNIVPVWNGSLFQYLPFAADITLTLTGAATAGSIVDVFGFNNAGVLQTGFGPVWATSTAGAGNRGVGAGTTQLARRLGLWTNANVITLLNGANTYSAIPANQATYLGSLLIDAVAGQVSCELSYGQSRKFGVWNAYHRKRIAMKAGDSTASWTYNSATIRASDGNSANAITVFAGLPEETAFAAFKQYIALPGAGSYTGAGIGIGINSTTAITGFAPQAASGTVGTYNAGYASAEIALAPFLGANVLNALERVGTGTATFNGTETNMLLTAVMDG